MEEQVKNDAGKIAVVFKGNYNESTTYEILDEVRGTDGTYRSLVSNNIGNSLSNTNYWVLVSKDGEKGDTGPQGEQGIQGETGPQGPEGKQGPQGPIGEIGPQGPAGRDGIDGTNGVDGADGHTPVAGVDYFTVEEKTEFKNAVVEESKTDIDTYTEEKKTEIENLSEQKKTEIEASKEDLKERVSELENVVSQMPTVEGEGTDFKLENTIDAPFLEKGIKGNTFQETFSGKNKLNIENFIPIATGRIEHEINKNTLKITATSGGTFRCGNIKVENLEIGQNYIVNVGSFSDTSESKIGFIGVLNASGAYYKSGNLSTMTSISFIPTETEVQIRLGYTSSVEEGAILTLNDVQLEKGSSVTDYEPYVGGIASPNIEYPQQIHNVSGNVKIEIHNKNLIRVQEGHTTEKYGVTATIKNGEIILNGLTKYATYINLCKIFLKAKQNYTLNINQEACVETADINTIQLYDETNSQALQVGANKVTHVRSQFKKDGWFTVRIGAEVNKNYDNFRIKAILAEEDVQDFTPYKSASAIFPLAEGQFLAEGDYLADDGIHHVKGKLNLTVDSTSEIIKSNYSNESLSVFAINKFNNLFVDDRPLICNYFINDNYIGTGPNRTTKEAIGYGSKNFGIRICIAKNVCDTPSDLKALLDKHNVEIEHELQKEIIEPYTPEQQKAYNERKKLHSYADTTYVVTSSGDLAPVARVKAIEKAAGVSEINNIKQAILSLGGNV